MVRSTFKFSSVSMNLRLACFLILLISAVVEAISITVNLSTIWYMSYQGVVPSYMFTRKFMLFLFVLFSVFKIALCAVLYEGLVERRPDHLEIWYKGYIVFESLYLALIIIKAPNETQDTEFWIFYVANICVILLTFYFIVIVRRYHHQMCRQPNFYQDFSTEQTSKMYSEKPKDANGEIILFSASTKDKDGSSPNFNIKDDDGVFATPQSSQMNLPVMPSFFFNDERKPSHSNEGRPSLDNGRKRSERERQMSSCSTPKATKQKLNVSFDDHIVFD